MDVAALLAEEFGRIGPVLHRAVRGLDSRGLTFRPDADANTLAWLVWHAGRVQDAQVADVAGIGQVWVVQGWAQRLGLPFAASATGYGQSSDDVALVDAPAELLLGYYDAVAEQTLDFLGRLHPTDLDEVVDESWDPPVTLGVRLVSILADDLQHAGQASYVRGLLDRSGR
ncbi:DUF664 domain-containing protein [Cellulomonas sp.]|uniref:mycothiol transferase n=1 Tax=Cellulomonas sp. TaxID=40001 RepID=UPI001B2B6896|nr:DUF664 domain-containing protein [Cellulomonas sp.]MBO9554731.1 DUF664 domain-containing protein [Cellulomonas sp.]